MRRRGTDREPLTKLAALAVLRWADHPDEYGRELLARCHAPDNPTRADVDEARQVLDDAKAAG